MLTGRVPFKAESEYLIFQKILKREFFFPDYFPEHAKNLVNKLLVRAENKFITLTRQTAPEALASTFDLFSSMLGLEP